MESPVKASGWTGRMDAPRTIERKRRGRETDRIIMPTPPRTQDMSHLPTPETVRRPAKPVGKVNAEPVVQTMLPTPQPLPRPPRKAAATSSGAEEEIITPPSPSGHTTFYLSSNGPSGSRGEKVSRRRPGLTFAQQMGLCTSGASGSSTRPGVGVGMGGSRIGGHRKDQVVWGHLAEPVALGELDDENPFITRPSDSATGTGTDSASTLGKAPKAPGRGTTHRPRREINDEETTGVECLEYLHPSPGLPTDPMTGLLTPPPTRPERGVRTIPKPSKAEQAEEARRRAHKERMKQMMDEKSNPFLVKPGESSSSRGRKVSPIVDETKPTVTYVFRGAKKVFANPFYPADAPFPQALLDTEDEDYEPHPNPKPRLLWPSPPAGSKRIQMDQEDIKSPSGASPPSSPIATPRRRLFTRHGQGDDDVHMISPQNDEEEDEDEEIVEMPTRRRLFAPAPAASAKRPAEQLNQAGRDEKRLKGMRV